jgi:membrane protease YdiL (CAAX protease family)
MAALILILAFPFITAVGFAVLHLSTWSASRGARNGMRNMTAYTVMLSLPVGAVIATLVATDTGFTDIGLQWPGAPSLLLRAGTATLIGGATGAVAFLMDRALKTRADPHTASGASDGKTDLRYLNGGASSTSLPAPDAPDTDAPQADPTDERRQVSALLPVVASAAVIGEEIAWRGYLLTFFSGTLSLHWATGLVLSAASFGLNHYYFGVREIVAKSVLGLLWGGLFLATGSLLAPIASHLVFNALALNMRIEWSRS